ncbi:MAG TPA: hypothetical protein VFO41_11945 [Alphaproteobacteria bacterium]|nr:hypothetical protein [Alphaproteobacteria bacterium]
MIRRILPLLFLLPGIPAVGQELVVETGPMRVSITEDVCAGLISHTPAPDVEYRPEVDVQGRPVAPADLPGSPRIIFPDAYRIPIEVDLVERLGIPEDATGFGGTVEVGTVTLVGDRLFFNGQPLTPTDEAAIARACRDVMR